MLVEENQLRMSGEGASSDVQAEDVPVNKITSFNGKLNQFLHIASISNGAAAADSSDIPQPEFREQLKRRRATSTGRTFTTRDREDSSSASSKRPKSSSTRATTSSSTTTLTSPRVTRSRSNSAIPPSPNSQSPTTQSPTRRRRPKKTPLDPSAPPTSSLLRDTIPSNLILLLVGVNPGLLTGTTGHAYAHPSNLFWKLLHSSGITAMRHPPSDTYKLPDLYSVGNTNIVERPTRDASMLSRAEMDAGVPVLEAKVAAQRPEAVCLVGKSIWEAVWRVRRGRGIRKEEFRYGWQDEEENMGRTRCDDWVGAPVFVATTTSGLAAGMSIPEKEAVWARLGAWVVQRRGERGVLSSSPSSTTTPSSSMV